MEIMSTVYANISIADINRTLSDSTLPTPGLLLNLHPEFFNQERPAIRSFLDSGGGSASPKTMFKILAAKAAIN
jgi:hypothetical protein